MVIQSELDVVVLDWLYSYAIEVFFRDAIAAEYAFLLFYMLPIGFVYLPPEAATGHTLLWVIVIDSLEVFASCDLSKVGLFYFFPACFF